MKDFVGLGGLSSTNSTTRDFVGLGGSQPQQSFLSKITGFIKPALKYGLKAASYISNPIQAVLNEKPVENFTKSVARATPRAGVLIGKDVKEIVTNQKSQTYTPGNQVTQALLGKDPINTFQQMAFEWDKKTQELADKAGIQGDKKKKAIGILGPLGAIAFTVGDLVPVTPGSAEAKILKELAKLKTVEEIIPILQKLGIAEEALQDTARAVSRLSRPKDVQKVLRAAEEVTDAIRPAAQVAEDVIPAVARVADDASLATRQAIRASEEAAPVAAKAADEIPDAARILDDIPPGADDAVKDIAKKAESARQLIRNAADEGEVLSPIQRLNRVFDEIPALNAEQKAIYSKERAARAAEYGDELKNATDEAGAVAAKQKLSGELTKVEIPSLRGKITQNDIDDIFRQVSHNPGTTNYEKAAATSGLQKLFRDIGGVVPTDTELAAMKRSLPELSIDAILKKRPLLKRVMEGLANVLGIPRSVMSSFDLSAPFRQGIFMAGHPKLFGRAFVSMIKSLGKEKAFQALQESIRSNKYYDLALESKLPLTSGSKSITGREEAFISTFAEQLPGEDLKIIGLVPKAYNKTFGTVVKKSQRAYTTFLDKIRMDYFADIISRAELAGKDVHAGSAIAESAARYVGSATGRGSMLAVLEKAAPALSGALFSPRLIASRLNLLNPLYYARLDPFVRKEALKTLFVDVALATAVIGGAKMAGFGVELNPTSSDFLKVRLPGKYGKTRYDILGGFQQYAVLAGRMAFNEEKSTTSGKVTKYGEGYKPKTRLTAILNFVGNKSAPLPASAINFLRGTDFTGQPTTVQSELLRTFTPIVSQDIRELYEQYDLKGIPLILPAFVGFGQQTYSGKKAKGSTKPGNPLNPKSI